MVRKLLLIFGIFGFVISAGLVLAPQAVRAVDVVEEVCENPHATEKPSFCDDNAAESDDNPIFGPDSVLAKVINILSWVVGIIAIFVIIICALKMMTSMGDPTGVAQARGGIIYASLALVITGAAQLVVRLLLSKL